MQTRKYTIYLKGGRSFRITAQRYSRPGGDHSWEDEKGQVIAYVPKGRLCAVFWEESFAR